MELSKLKFSPPSYTKEEESAVAECIRNKWTGSGPKVLEFEKNFRNYKKSQYSAGFFSCTSSLFLALKVLGVTQGDEVITTSMTFCSTVNCIINCGAKPVLCDIDFDSKNISPEEIEKKITTKTKAIIPVHFAGYPCEMDRIMKIARKYKIFVIEDCAHAIESKFNNQHCGTFGDIGCFSFYATKNIAIGEGGMAISNNQELISKMSVLGLHGLSKDAWKRFEKSQKKSYDVIEIGHKMNMTDIQASIGIAQLSRIGEMKMRRKEIWEFYSENLKGTSLLLPKLDERKGNVHALHLYSVGLPKYMNRDEFVWKASNDFGITFGVHYNAIPTFSAYKDFFPKESSESLYPNSMDWGQRCVSLSLSAAVKDKDCERIVDCVKSLL